MNLKTATVSLLAVVAASLGAYSYWENSSTNTTTSVEAESSGSAVGHRQRRLALEEPVECEDFGRCCTPVETTRRRLGKRHHSFEADVVDSSHRDLLSCGETAYARMTDGKYCFTNPEENVGANRWGWRLEIDGTVSSTQTFDVWAGAGQCDITKSAEKVGVFTLSYNAETEKCTGYYTADSGYSANAFHFYCGVAPYPTKPNGGNIVAGGQLGCQHTNGPYKTTPVCEFTVPSGPTISAIAHFESCSGAPASPTVAPAPTPAPVAPTPTPNVCDITASVTCVNPTEFCESLGYVLCGTGCCRKNNGKYQFEVEAKCEQSGTRTFCPKECDDGSVFGDPHFRTWHKQHEFEYHGECDLVFLKAPAMDMDIHVRTTIRYDYSFVSQAAVRIGKEIFEIASWGEYQLDGMSSIDLPAFIGGFPITRTEESHGKTKFVIHLEQDKEILMTSFKDYVSVRIENGTLAMYDGSSGIMGDFQTGSMYMRDGTTIETDPNVYAPEWQVRPEVDGVLFAGEREPVYPQRCVLPDASAISARARKLGEARISREQAEAACAGKSVENRSSCVEDVLKTQDLDIVNA